MAGPAAPTRRAVRSVLVAAVCGLLVAACSAAPSAGPAASAPDRSVSPSVRPSATTDPTAPGTDPGEPLVLSFLGDIGSGEAAAAVLDGVRERADAATFVVGDLSYGEPGAEADWCAFVHDHVGAEHPVQLVSGNHDDDGPNGDIAAFTACLPNRLPGLVGDYGRQWYLDLPAEHPVVRVVMISPGLDFGDGVWSYERGTSHHEWTRGAIEGARAAGVPWVVVGMHFVCLSVGRYDCGAGPDLASLLVGEGVDLVVTGHEHLYQRTAPLTLGPGCRTIVPGRYDTDCLARTGGTTVVTVGTGGVDLRDAADDDPERPYFRAVSAADEQPAHGSLALRVDERSLTSTFEPVDGAGFTDEVRLTR